MVRTKRVGKLAETVAWRAALARKVHKGKPQVEDGARVVRRVVPARLMRAKRGRVRIL